MNTRTGFCWHLLTMKYWEITAGKLSKAGWLDMGLLQRRHAPRLAVGS